MRKLQARFVADIDEMNRMVSGALDLFKGLNDEEPMAQVLVDDLLAIAATGVWGTGCRIRHRGTL